MYEKLLERRGAGASCVAAVPYRTRDLVPPHLMPEIRKGRVQVKNAVKSQLS